MTKYAIDYFKQGERKLFQESVEGEEAAHQRAREIANDPTTLGQATAYYAHGEEKQGQIAFIEQRNGWDFERSREED